MLDVRFWMIWMLLVPQIAKSKVKLAIGVVDTQEDTLMEGTSPAVTLAIKDAKNQGLLDGIEDSVHWMNYRNSWVRASDWTMKHRYGPLKVDVFIGYTAIKVRRFITTVLAVTDTPVLIGGIQENLRYSKWAQSTAWFGPTTGQLSKLVKHIFQAFKWKKAMMIRNDDALCESIASAIPPKIKIGIGKLASSARAYHKKLLLSMQKNYKVGFLCTSPTTLQKLLLLADEMGMMKGNYVYFYVDIDDKRRFELDDFTDKGSSPDIIGRNKRIMQHVKCILPEVRHTELMKNPIVKEVLKELRRPPWNWKRGLDTSFKQGHVWAMFTYDATMTYLTAVNMSIQQGLDYKKASKLYNQITGRTWNGESGTFTIGKNRERIYGYTVWHRTPEQSKYVPWITLERKNSSLAIKYLSESYWATADGKPPSDTPSVCDYQPKKCIPPEKAKNGTSDANVTQQAGKISGVVMCLIVILVVGSIIVFMKRKQENDLTRMVWKVDYEEIEFVDGSLNNSKTIDSSLSTVRVKNCPEGSTKSTDVSASDDIQTSRQGTTKNGLYQGQAVFVTFVQMPSTNLSHIDLVELKAMKEFKHDNINRFVGANIDPPNTCVLTQRYPNGSLQEILESGDIILDWDFKYSMISDLAKGMQFLHSSVLKSHGSLKSSSCLVDSRCVLKITDYGLHVFKKDVSCRFATEDLNNKDMLWTAPEILRLDEAPRNGTQLGDIYSFSIIMQEILYRSLPYLRPDMTPEEIVRRIKNKEDPVFRPLINTHKDEKVDTAMIDLMTNCWNEDPICRPQFTNIRRNLKTMSTGQRSNLANNLLEKYTSNLEDVIEQRTEELIEAKKKTDMLLRRMLPPSVASVIIAGGKIQPKQFESVTIYFSDIVDFNSLSSESSPVEMVNLLNDLYNVFDGIIAKCKVYKVETIGEKYMVASGLPKRNGNKHVEEISTMALHLLSAAYTEFEAHSCTDGRLKLRIGINTGPCVAGVIGQDTPRYCLFGDAVMMASRMESSGQALRIHISSSTYESLQSVGGYLVEFHEELEIKGKGVQKTYWLLGKETFNKELPPCDINL